MTVLSFLAVGLFANISSDLFDCDKKKLVRGQVLIIPSVCVGKMPHHFVIHSLLWWFSCVY